MGRKRMHAPHLRKTVVGLAAVASRRTLAALPVPRRFFLLLEFLPVSTLLSPPASPTAFGVGFDTSRYGHHVTFLRADLQLACLPFEFPESRSGYDQVLRRSSFSHVPR